MNISDYYCYARTVSKEKYMEEKSKILSDFGIPFTKDIEDKLNELYPREIAIESYIRKLIAEKLSS